MKQPCKHVFVIYCDVELRTRAILVNDRAWQEVLDPDCFYPTCGFYRESYIDLNSLRIIPRFRHKKAFFSDQCKEIEENNRMGKTRDPFKKIRDTKGTFHAKMGSIKDRNGMDLTEAAHVQWLSRAQVGGQICKSCKGACLSKTLHHCIVRRGICIKSRKLIIRDMKNYNEVPPYTSQDSHQIETLQITNAGEGVVKKEPS